MAGARAAAGCLAGTRASADEQLLRALSPRGTPPLSCRPSARGMGLVVQPLPVSKPRRVALSVVHCRAPDQWDEARRTHALQSWCNAKACPSTGVSHSLQRGIGYDEESDDSAIDPEPECVRGGGAARMSRGVLRRDSGPARPCSSVLAPVRGCIAFALLLDASHSSEPVDFRIATGWPREWRLRLEDSRGAVDRILHAGRAWCSAGMREDSR